ncbi:hypothetical protein D3C71_1662140 [compost metagenome]
MKDAAETDHAEVTALLQPGVEPLIRFRPATGDLAEHRQGTLPDHATNQPGLRLIIAVIDPTLHEDRADHAAPVDKPGIIRLREASRKAWLPFCPGIT